jgi:hypothetical protein
MSTTNKLFILFFLLSLAGTSLARGRLRDSYQHFFPDVRAEITEALTQNCSSLFNSYLQEDVILYGSYCVKTYSCIVENLDQYTQANMASSGVLLGLTPWLLSTLGSTTIEMSLLSSRRPLLAAMLVLGSPAMNPVRAFVDYNPIETQLSPGDKYLAPSKVSGTTCAFYILLEFVAAAASIANLATMSWTLARNTISTMSCDDSDILAELWIGLALFTHLFGIITFVSRAEIGVDCEERDAKWNFRKARLWLGLVREFRLCVNQQPLQTTWGKENWKFFFWSWLAAFYTVAHLAFGTLVFSSLSFVGECSRTLSLKKDVLNAMKEFLMRRKLPLALQLPPLYVDLSLLMSLRV